MIVAMGLLIGAGSQPPSLAPDTMTLPVEPLALRRSQSPLGDAPSPAAHPSVSADLDKPVTALDSDEPGEPPASRARRPRSVLVIGDSSGVRLVKALQSWGKEHGVVVDGAAAGGCSPSLGRWLLRLDLPGLAELPAVDVCVPPEEQVAAAEVVIASYQGTLLFEHRLPDETWTSLDRSAPLRADVHEQLRRVASMTSGRLVLLSVPEPRAEWDNVQPAARDDANQVLTRLAAELPNVEYVDTAAVDREPERYPRSDGLHLDPEGVDVLIDEILDYQLYVG